MPGPFSKVVYSKRKEFAHFEVVSFLLSKPRFGRDTRIYLKCLPLKWYQFPFKKAASFSKKDRIFQTTYWIGIKV